QVPPAKHMREAPLPDQLGQLVVVDHHARLERGVFTRGGCRARGEFLWLAAWRTHRERRHARGVVAYQPVMALALASLFFGGIQRVGVRLEDAQGLSAEEAR